MTCQGKSAGRVGHGGLVVDQAVAAGNYLNLSATATPAPFVRLGDAVNEVLVRAICRRDGISRANANVAIAVGSVRS